MSYVENTWGLTPAQCATLTAISNSGTSKGAAKGLGISHRTVETQLQRAMEKMNVNYRIHAVLAWDRHTRDKAIVAALILPQTD